LLNATVGLQRLFARRQSTPRRTTPTVARSDVYARYDSLPNYDSARTNEALSRYASATTARLATTARPATTVRRSTARRQFAAPRLRVARPRLGHEALLPFAVILIVVVATAASAIPGVTQPAVGGPNGDGVAPRIGINALTGAGSVPNDGSGPTDAGSAGVNGVAYKSGARGMDRDVLGGPGGANPSAAALRGPFLPDGTLVKPVAVNTAVADGSGLLKKYTVRRGETLTGIAHRFGVSVKTIWWANNLNTKNPFHAGMTLTIPPVDGVVVKAAEGDTLDSVAAQYEVDPQAIYALNGLQDTVLVAGQTLILPGAVGTSIPTTTVTKPKPPVSHPSSGGGSGGNDGGVGTPSVRPPDSYSGGKFTFPVVGGNHYISQYFHGGHFAIDIAADYGTKVVAGGAGVVIFAGWKTNGGGYQVWIAHGSDLYTTYNHMSAITVGIGESVSRGQQVGRIGQTGNATGPHLHFEVWRGPVWDGGTRVNPLLYL
jgi:murein DD-endopeptidase MepM/ murein hydrolase activator NlpD